MYRRAHGCGPVTRGVTHTFVVRTTSRDSPRVPPVYLPGHLGRGRLDGGGVEVQTRVDCKRVTTERTEGLSFVAGEGSVRDGGVTETPKEVTNSVDTTIYHPNKGWR